ncbi:MAG: acyl carrier protein [Deltaproteobacteria bacterium]|nr:acyl carrier protein [Deltaproteobacteria bacterium]
MADTLATFIQDSLLLGKPTDVRGLASFLEAGIIDSTGVLELVQFIEETWDCKVADDDMVPDNLDSLPRLVAFIQKKRAG